MTERNPCATRTSLVCLQNKSCLRSIQGKQQHATQRKWLKKLSQKGKGSSEKEMVGRKKREEKEPVKEKNVVDSGEERES